MNWKKIKLKVLKLSLSALLNQQNKISKLLPVSR